ncbi:MAG: mechanosensitive ion channel protein MscS [Prevotellaceae bacterium]|nr:mechanosensitive ion channel protein MscS [Prevotellaceae bacterium]
MENQNQNTTPQDNPSTASTVKGGGQQESVAVKPHHRMEKITDHTPMLRVRNYLNIAFMILALIGVAIFFIQPLWRQGAMIIMLIAVVIKIIEVSLRLFHH